jgi:hypothetical protein
MVSKPSSASRREILRSLGAIPFISFPFENQSNSPDIDEVRNILDGIFREHFENEQEVEQITREVATDLCPYSDALSEINMDQFDEEDVLGSEELRRVHEIAAILNDHFDAGIDTDDLDQAYDKARSVEKYLPIIASATRLVDESCKLSQEDADGSLKKLYIATGVFAAECALFTSTAPYRVSFSGTRYVTNNLLVYYRERMGLTLYAVLLREVHWAIRGTIAGFPSYLWNKTEELADDYDEFAQPKLTDVFNIDILGIGDWIKAWWQNR